MKLPTPNTFASRVRRLRRCKHLTQRGLAVEVGCTQVTVSLWETGIHFPKRNSEHLCNLAAYFGTTPEYLLTGSEW